MANYGLTAELDVGCAVEDIFTGIPSSQYEGSLETNYFRYYNRWEDINGCNGSIYGFSEPWDIILSTCAGDAMCSHEEWESTHSILDPDGYKQCMCRGHGDGYWGSWGS